eukprot:7161582-Lingulodinium_polyedra.AAC.1
MTRFGTIMWQSSNSQAIINATFKQQRTYLEPSERRWTVDALLVTPMRPARSAPLRRTSGAAPIRDGPLAEGFRP